MEEQVKLYLDSSVFLAQLLREGNLQSWNDLEGKRYTSELTELECRRTLDRIRLLEQLEDDEIAERLNELELILQSTHVIALNGAVLKRAKASYPTIVRSLDALHLASAELSNTSLFLTLDKQQATAAKAIGLKVKS